MIREKKYYSYSKIIGRIVSPISLKKRKEMYEKFIKLSSIKNEHTILDVGVTADSDNCESNFFEDLYPFKNRITAVGISDASFLEKKYSGLRFIRVDGKELPFSDNSFDYVFSSAVIEHVGTKIDQLIFLKELNRVAKRGVFITTPNRWFPVETHTCLFLVHWLPNKWFRNILYLLKKSENCDEAALNLLSHSILFKMCQEAGISQFSIFRSWFLGFTSNFMLYIDKVGANAS